MIYQIGAIQAFAKVLGTKVEHFESHGNLALMSFEDKKIATPIAEAIAGVDPNLIWVVLGGVKGEMVTEVAKKVGIRVTYEGFPDRAYTPDGTLVSRRQPGAVIKDPEIAAQRALLMSHGKVIAVDGREIPLNVQTLCVHGDTPGAINLVKTIRAKLTAEKVEVVPVRKIL